MVARCEDCQKFNADDKTCDLISKNIGTPLIEDLMNSSNEVLSNFLLSNECHGDFKNMLNNMTHK